MTRREFHVPVSLIFVTYVNTCKNQRFSRIRLY